MGALFTGALGLALPTPQPVPAAMTPSGPLARYLARPGATTARLLHHLAQLQEAFAEARLLNVTNEAKQESGLHLQW